MEFYISRGVEMSVKEFFRFGFRFRTKFVSYKNRKRTCQKNWHVLYEPKTGLEPVTHALRMRCSTNWATSAAFSQVRQRRCQICGCKGNQFFQSAAMSKHFFCFSGEKKPFLQCYYAVFDCRERQNCHKSNAETTKLHTVRTGPNEYSLTGESISSGDAIL